MIRVVMVCSACLAIVAPLAAQPEADPPVIAKMGDLGTVYVTRKPAKKSKKADGGAPRKTVVIGVDFRPTADTDPKKIAEAVRELATLPDLEFVLLLGHDVDDDAAAAIPSGAKLKSIQFFNTGVTDKGIAGLTRLKNLQIFKFTGGGLTDRGMQELAKIKTLHTIEITDAKVTDAGVLALQVLPNLQRLVIENTLARQEAIDRLRERLPRLIDGDRVLK